MSTGEILRQDREPMATVTLPRDGTWHPSVRAIRVVGVTLKLGIAIVIASTVCVFAVCITLLIALGKDPTTDVTFMGGILASTIPAILAYAAASSANERTKSVEAKVNGQMSALMHHAGIDPEVAGITPDQVDPGVSK